MSSMLDRVQHYDASAEPKLTELCSPAQIGQPGVRVLCPLLGKEPTTLPVRHEREADTDTAERLQRLTVHLVGTSKVWPCPAFTDSVTRLKQPLGTPSSSALV